MPAQRVALALALVVTVAYGIGCRVRTATLVHRVFADGTCEDVYPLSRPPSGRWDHVGVHRLARCEDDDRRAPAIFYLPGMHMNGELPRDDRAVDFRRLLAAAGVRVWSVDYRTHAVPADASAGALSALETWTADLFADDAAAAALVAREVDAGPFYVAGFSFGAGIAYRLAARNLPMDGLVVLDGMPPDGRAPEPGAPAIDVGGTRLPYAERERLLAAVLENPRAPSPLRGFATAGDALADVIFTARTFGGAGGLSAAKAGVTDVRSLAALLAGYDRWWPRAALGGSRVVPAGRTRVLAFTSTTTGSAWLGRVRAGARAFGGEDAQVHELPGHGHLDVLIGRDVGRLVVDPTVAFVAGR